MNAIRSMPLLAPRPPMVGREAEVNEIIDLIDHGSGRIVTLLGTGGVGKTRLAQEVAATMAPRFVHGASFIGLEAVRTPDLVPTAIARGLGLQPSVDLEIDTLLATFLDDRHMLLVLDNLEHIIQQASEWLPGLLASAPRIRILATSRIALSIDLEQQYVVSPLPIGQTQLAQSAAIVLFAQRATAVNQNFRLDDDSVAIVAEICRKLDGLPLAIELAAARTRILSLPALLAGLTDQLVVLAGGQQDVPMRLRSMRDAIAWSYDLLSEADQSVFRRLSVFLNGFTLEAAAFVAAWPDAPDAEPQVLDSIHSLMNQSLIHLMPGEGEQRFRMLETIREYGLHVLHQTGEEDLASRAHAGYFREIAERAETGLMGPDQTLWLDQLEMEYPNLGAAMSWLETHDDVASAIELGARILYFIGLVGHGSDLLERCGLWLMHPTVEEPTRSRGLALLVMGTLMFHTGASSNAAMLIDEAIRIFNETDDRFHEAVAWWQLSFVYEQLLEIEPMRFTSRSALDLARPLGLLAIESDALDKLSYVARLTGDHDQERQLAQQSEDSALRSGAPLLIARVDMYRSDDAQLSMDLDTAETYLWPAIHSMERLGARVHLPHLWGRMAWIALERGQPDVAADHLVTGLRIAESCGDIRSFVHLTMRKGYVDTVRGQLSMALSELQEVLTHYHRYSKSADIAWSLDALVLLAMRAGDTAIAVRFLGASATCFEEAGLRPERMFYLANGYLQRDALRVSLGARSFDRAYSEGAAWTIAESVAEALAYEPSGISPDKPLAPSLSVPLSPREQDVLIHMANGLSNQQIADELFVSYRTITTHVSSIMTRLDVPSRTAAVAWAIRNGVV